MLIKLSNMLANMPINMLTTANHAKKNMLATSNLARNMLATHANLATKHARTTC